MKKLYHIRVEFYGVIDENDDPDCAARELMAESDGFDVDFDVEQANSVALDWKKALPFGENEGMTCAEWLARGKKVAA